jgi:hypothetical protein
MANQHGAAEPGLARERPDGATRWSDTLVACREVAVAGIGQESVGNLIGAGKFTGLCLTRRMSVAKDPYVRSRDVCFWHLRCILPRACTWKGDERRGTRPDLPDETVGERGRGSRLPAHLACGRGCG